MKYKGVRLVCDGGGCGGGDGGGGGGCKMFVVVDVCDV